MDSAHRQTKRLRSLRRGRRLAVLAAAVAFAAAGLAPAVAAATGWTEVDYGALVDGRRISHSGESIEALLARLDGRGVPPAGERPGDRLAHSLLEPMVEGFAFVLPDTLDRVHGVDTPPLFEVAGLWHPGARQPAWVELLRARRYVVESDGAGRMRICVPWTAAGDPPADPVEAARIAWTDAWPVLRHVVAAERMRLSESAPSDAEPVAIRVEVHAYRHHPERSRFRLGLDPWTATLDDDRPDGRRPPLDLAGWQAFLDEGLRLEGARLDPDGRVRLLGSRADAAPTLLGRPISLADLAVAYRAVFHGGLAEPYMSLDRGYSPQTAVVNYGGRLRDTALGMVSLLCDVRFKTFSLGLDIAEGRDLRAELRRRLPDFRSHTERFAAHPDSERITSQQTRLWFYPDRVDLTVSPESDVLVLRRVRMSAASERLETAAGAPAAGEDPPWTLATVRAIDRDYDTLAEVFPELADLDQVVRLLSLFTWLRQAEDSGLPVPDLGALLAVELPALTTPRTYPQLLAFNALPPPESGAESEVFDRVPVAESLERLNPEDGQPFAPRLRLARALAGLDRDDPQNAALLAETARYDLGSLTDTELDALAFRAERMRMHGTVLSTLEPSQVEKVTRRQQAGERLRVFSVGIGGLDLGMGQALARSGSRSLSLTGVGAGPRPADLAVAGGDAGDESALTGEPLEEWRREATGLRRAPMPDHGLAGAGSHREFGDAWLTRVAASPTSASGARVWSLAGAQDREVRSRRVALDGDGRLESVERIDGLRFLRYTLRENGDAFVVALEPEATTPPPDDPTRTLTNLPEGLATLRVGAPATAPAGELTPALALRLDASPGGTPRLLEADFPRALLQRVALGPDVDRTPGRPLPAFQPLPPALGAVDALMFLANEPQRLAPWDSGLPRVAGEEDPVRLARSMTEWWSRAPESIAPAVVGTDAAVSPARWARAPRVAGAPLLLLPGSTTAGPAGRRVERVRDAWSGGPVATALDGAPEAELVVYVSDEPPGQCAARLGELAGRVEMKGKLLAGWCLAGTPREDLPARWLAQGVLAGVGLAESTVVELRHVERSMEALSRGSSSGAGGARAERLPGPFLWYF
jgi:hypothetical protein